MAELTFSVVIPYYNEDVFLPHTLHSWLAQARQPDELILVDNASTDRSEAVCHTVLAAYADTQVRFLSEPRPGKIHALQLGCETATGTYIVFSDADTYYPPHYLELIERLLHKAKPSVVAVMALSSAGAPHRLSERLSRGVYVALSRICQRQVFSGGYAQTLSATALRQVGGFSESYWPYVLLDHEIMHRLFKVGRSIYHTNLWCRPSSRRSDRRRVRWNLLERCLYFVTPYVLKDWFFYQFLASRFARRKMHVLNLREKSWESKPY